MKTMKKLFLLGVLLFGYGQNISGSREVLALNVGDVGLMNFIDSILGGSNSAIDFSDIGDVPTPADSRQDPNPISSFDEDVTKSQLEATITPLTNPQSSVNNERKEEETLYSPTGRILRKYRKRPHNHPSLVDSSDEDSSKESKEPQKKKRKTTNNKKKKHKPTKKVTAVIASRKKTSTSEERTVCQWTVDREICKERFNTSKELGEHILEKHKTTGSFKCQWSKREGDICVKEFRQRSHLIKHIRTHTKEKPFECEECGRKFAQSGNLRSHIQTHTEEKPFECEECGRKFALQALLKRHMFIHTGEKPFQCTECNRRFARKSALRVHMQKKHS